MNKQRKALLMALEALDSDNPDIMLRASIAIREALAEPEPKELTELEKRITDLEELRRVAALNHDAIVDAIHRMYQNRKPLTDEQLLEWLISVDSETKRLPMGFKLFARAIERAHGIGEA